MKITLHIDSGMGVNEFLTAAAAGLRSVSDEGEAVIAALEAAVHRAPTARDSALVAAVLEAHGGNVSATARSLGIARATVRARLAKGARIEASRAADEWRPGR
jgi:transcriptional regulator of acetoin/glycerol metabolism